MLCFKMVIQKQAIPKVKKKFPDSKFVLCIIKNGHPRDWGGRCCLRSENGLLLLRHLDPAAAFLQANQVQGRAGFEPLNLALVVGVVQRNQVGVAVGVVQAGLQGLAGGEVGQTEDVDGVAFLNQVVVGLVGEGEAQHALLLEVGFVDTREALHNHGAHAEVAGLHGGVLARGAFAVVLVANDHRADAHALVAAGGLGHGGVAVALGRKVAHLVGLAVEGVGGPDEHVIGDVVQMAAELQPRAGHRNVVRRALALGLDEQAQPFQVGPT